MTGAVRNSVTTQIGTALVASHPTEIAKPSRGLYVPITTSTGGRGAAASVPIQVPTVAPSSGYKEEDFYESFAAYLQNDLDEATVAQALGGASFKDKWG